ncbi:hypothetical protein [Ligilactobacillus animalis]|uniref:hypothetical protein n=1 Tax=Ligilactobacillus animalis TaxID=1605 RepID=UPI0027C8FF38|nr:hypothetical protein [Ligilactobacillus animalis]MDQ2233784.1 hypothetical protein [Ligilactobacillus animalis]
MTTPESQAKIEQFTELMQLQGETGIEFCGREYFFEPIFSDDPFKAIGWRFSTLCFRK